MKRCALYITGHFRNFNETWNQYATLFVNSPLATFDVYCTLWDVRNTDDPTPIHEEDVRAVCPHATSIRILPSSEPVETYRHTLPVASQLYGIHRAFQDLPDSYDWYIRLRTDLYFFDGDFLTQILTSTEPADLWIPKIVWYTEPNYPVGDVFNDYMWVGRYGISKYIADTYPCLRDIAPTYAEQLLGRRVRSYAHPLRIQHFDCLFNLDRRTRGYDMYLLESRELTRLRQDQGTVRFNFQNPLHSKK